MRLRSLLVVAAAAAILVEPVAAQQMPDGSPARPLRVTLVPADGGTEDGTKADFAPLFAATTKATGLNFELKVGQTYGAVVEAICGGVTEIAFFGAATYLPARERGCAELLAVDVHHGQSVYYSGIFVRADAPITALADLKGRSVTFGDANSTSSFVYPVAMLLAAGLDPAKDLAAVRLTGSHANSLKALAEGQVDAAAASFDSFEKAVNQKVLEPGKFRVLAKSDPIPNPPIAMSTKLPADTKARLKAAFGRIHAMPGVDPAMIRAYGGKKVERYDVAITDEMMAPALVTLAKVGGEMRKAILEKAAAAR